MKQLLAAIDFSKNTDIVLNQAGKLAKSLNAKLWVTHVTPDETQFMVNQSESFNGFTDEFNTQPVADITLARNLAAETIRSEHAQLHEMSAALRDDGVDAHALLLKGNPAEQIKLKADELQVDIIIIGSHGHSLMHKALLGSVSEATIRHSAHNVMVVPMPAE